MRSTVRSTTSSVSSVDVPSDATCQELGHLSNIIHLLHHHNKNQHRRSPWYRHFDHFRRQLRHLLSELQDVQQTAGPPMPDLKPDTAFGIATHLASAAQRRQLREDGRATARARLGTWAAHYTRRWHAAFSQLLSDPQFAALGLVLLAALARATSLAGILGKLDQVEASREDGNDSWSVRDKDAAIAEDTEEDLGVKVQRTRDVLSGSESDGFRNARRRAAECRDDNGARALAAKDEGRLEKPRRAERLLSSESVTPPQESKLIQKREPLQSKGRMKPAIKGDAIDDLFSGLA